MSYELFRPRGSDSLTTSDSNEFNVLTPSASSFDINLYQNRAEATKIDKTEFLTYITTVSGALRTETSLQAPTIIIEYSRVPNFNYCHIQSFGRYYFIRNITSINNNLWQIELNCDVLFSFRANIMQLNAYVARNELKFTPQIPDDKYKVSDIFTQTRLEAQPLGGYWYTSDDYTFYNFMIQVQGTFKNGTTEIDTKMPVPTLKGDYVDMLRVLTLINEVPIPSGLIKTVADYLINLYALPCPVHFDPDESVTKIDIPGLSDVEFGDYPLYQPISIYTEQKFVCDLSNYLEDIDEVNEYKNTPPYKTITLEFNPFGTYEIPYSIIRDSAKLYLRVKVNVLTGDSQLYYGGTQANINIYMGQANVSIKFPYTTSVYNIQAIEHVANAASIVKGITTKDVGAIAKGATAEIKTVAESLNPATSVNQGAYNWISKPIIYVRDIAQQEPNTALYGRPYYKNANLTELSGYTEIERIHIEDMPNATIDEAQEIERLLKSGVII